MLEQRPTTSNHDADGVETKRKDGVVLDVTDSTSIGSSTAGSVEETAAKAAAGSLNPPIRDSLQVHSIQGVEKENNHETNRQVPVVETSSSPLSDGCANSSSKQKNTPPPRKASKVRFTDDAESILINPIPEFLYQDVFWSETELSDCMQHAKQQVQTILKPKTPCPHIQTMEGFYDTTSKEEDPEWKRTNHLEAWSRSEYRGLELWCSAKMQQEQKRIKQCILNYSNFLRHKQKPDKEELLRIRCENLTKPARDFAMHKGKSDIQHSIQNQNNKNNNTCSRNESRSNKISHVAAASPTNKDQSFMKRMESDTTDATKASLPLTNNESHNPQQQQMNKKKSMIRKCFGRLKLYNKK